MLNKIISFSVNNKLVVGLLTLGLVFYGIYQVTLLPIDAVPDITDNQVQVITISPSLGAPDVERLITFPIEQVNSNIPGLKEIRSFSRFGLSLVTIVFDDATDVYWARQQVSERLQQVQAQIPPDVGIPEMAPVTTGLGEIYQYVVKTKPGYESKYSLNELRTIQDWIIRRQLLGTPGVADVSSFGGKLKQYDVIVDDAKLSSLNINISDVCRALESNNGNTGGSYIERGPSILFIRTEGLVTSIDDINNVVIKMLQNGLPLLVKDVATVQEGSAIRYGAMCYNAEGEVAGAVVMMLKGENSSSVIKNVKERITEIQKTLPEGIVIEAFLDRTKMVDNAIGTVEKNLIEGAIIVILILVVFLGNFRAGIVVASVIPLSLLFAIILMNTFGVSGNLMSLGALDFGLIVDGAVIIVEAVMHRLTHSKHFASLTRITQPEMNEEVKSSASRMMNAAIFGQIIILIVYLPILSLQGIEGKMFKPMAQTVAFALLGAFILSLTYIPMMSSLFLSKKISHQPGLSDRMMIKLEKIYGRALEKVLTIPKTVIASAAALFVISILILGTLGGEFIPELEEGDFAVDTRVLTGSNLNTTIASTQLTAKTLMENFPEVEKVVTKIGSGEIPTDPMPIEASDMMVILKNKDEWTSAKSFDELAEKMSDKLSQIPGITAGFQYPVQMRFNELMTGARQDVVCKIFGENLDTLSSYAEKLGEIIKHVDGAKDLYVETVTGMPQIVIKPKRDILATYGLTIDEINQTVNAAFSGQITGAVFEDEKRFNLSVSLKKTGDRSVEDVRNLLITAPSGQQLPLRTFADIDVIDGPNQIQREDTRRRIIVGFNVRGRDVESVVNDLRAGVDKQIQFPAGYSVKYGGSFENMKAAKARLSFAVPISLVLIFIMLYFAFRSMKEGLIIFSAIPFSAIGGVLALFSRNMPFSISAGIGFIALFGVAVLNGIVLISEFNRLKQEGWNDARRIVLMGTKIRLRPVLMTAAVASLGFLPMALSNGAGAEVQRPLATVVIGGLVSATLLTLFVLPLIYMLTDKKQAKSGVSATALPVVIALIAFSTQNIQAQSSGGRFDLEYALNSAMKTNFHIQNSASNTALRKELSESAFDPSKTNFGFEYGQINTSLHDTKFNIQQSLQLPASMIARRKLFSEQLNEAIQNERLTKNEVQINVERLYYEWQTLFKTIEYLNNTDSLYAEMISKIKIRTTAGESELLELAYAENQRAVIAQNLADQRTLQQLTEQDLLLITGIPSDQLPIAGDYISQQIPETDSLLLSTHPLIIAGQSRVEQADQSTKIERSILYPQLTVGYSNMSIRGYETINGSDVFHTPSDRFSSATFALNLPIFQKAQRKRIAASEIMLKQKQMELTWSNQQLASEYRKARIQYQNALDNFLQAEKTYLSNAEKIINISNARLASGEISTLQWIVLINDATTARMRYVECARLYNQSCLDLKSIIYN